MAATLLIECYYYPGCRSVDVLPERVKQALAAEQITAHVEHRIVSPKEGAKLGITGSPTVRINGVEIDQGSSRGQST